MSLCRVMVLGVHADEYSTIHGLGIAGLHWCAKQSSFGSRHFFFFYDDQIFMSSTVKSCT